MTLSLLSSHLWEFSLELYRQPGVAPMCLTLQDQWDADVNIMLWLRWLETEGMPINATRIRLAETHIHGWQKDAVLPLRQLRRRLKQRYGLADKAMEAVRRTVKLAELQSERVVQIKLEKLARAWLAGVERKAVVPGANLAIYADALLLPPELKTELQRALCSPQ